MAKLISLTYRRRICSCQRSSVSLSRASNSMSVRLSSIEFCARLCRLSHMEAGSFIRSIQVRPGALSTGPGRAGTELQPNLPEGHLALGFCYYYGDWITIGLLRNSNRAKWIAQRCGVLLSLARIQRRQGKWAESTANFEKAAAINPKDSWVLQNWASNYEALRRYEAANKTFDRGIELVPSSMGLHA